MNQNERLDYLVEQFKEDSVQYRDLETPADPAGKKRILRSLMNIRILNQFSNSVCNYISIDRNVIEMFQYD